MKRTRLMGLALIATFTACSPRNELAIPEEDAVAAGLAAPNLGQPLHAGAGYSGLPVLARSAFLDPGSTIRILERAYPGTDAVSGFASHEGRTYSVTPKVAFRHRGLVYLLVHHAQDNESHAAQGYLSAFVFEEEGLTLRRGYPFFVSGGAWGGQTSWGAEPTISVVPLPDGAVLVLQRQHYQQQGYESDWEDVLLLDEAEAVEMDRIDTFTSSEGAAVGDMPFEVEKLIGAELQADGRSIRLQYQIERKAGAEIAPSGRTAVYGIR